MIIFEEFLNKYIDKGISSDKLIAAISSLSPIFNKIQIEDDDRYISVLKCFHEQLCGKHFNEYFAKEQVKCMYHTKSNGLICKGEAYCLDFAKRVFNDCVKHINKDITVWDVYVAINAQYHDHVVEYTKWFGKTSKEDIDDKLIEGAVNFWFKDEDADDDKVWNYFKTIG